MDNKLKVHGPITLDIYVNLYMSTAVKGNWFPKFRQLDF